MEAPKYRNELIILVARNLATSHGIFFAAALLADFDVPLGRALFELSISMPPKTYIEKTAGTAIIDHTDTTSQ